MAKELTEEEKIEEKKATDALMRGNISPHKGGRKETPTVLQMEATECGAASLAMILGYYGLYVSLEELRVGCGVSRDGSKAKNVLVAARNYGMYAKGFRREPDRIYDLVFPMILFWNFNHFVVLEGIKGDKVYLNDPAAGHRIITMEEFDGSFTGVCLNFSPRPDFKKGGSLTSVWRGLWNRLGVSKVAFSFVVFATLALVFPGLIIPVFSKIFIDDVLIKGSGDWMLPLIIGMIGTGVLRALLTWMQQYFLTRLELKLSITTSSNFFWHLMNLPMTFYSQRYVGDLNQRMSSNDKVAQLVTSGFSVNIINLICVFFYGIVLFMYDFLLAAIAVPLVLSNFVFLHLVSKIRDNYSRRLLNEVGKIAGTSINGIFMIETLKAGGTENDFFSKWSGYQANALGAMHQLGFIGQLIGAVPPLLNGLTTLAILGVGGWRVMEGAITIGGLVAFQSLMGSFSGPISGLVSLGAQLQTIKADIARLDDVLKYEPDKRIIKGVELPEEKDDIRAKLSGQVSLDNITFGYSVLSPALITDFCLDIKPGSRVAIVGSSGSGKSTIARIIAGLLDPWDGEIAFDGREVTGIPRQVMANSLAFVDQEITMFSGTVRENVTLWNTTVSELNMTQALRDAEIDDVVNARSQRYDAEIEENGRNYSGGQRQRLEIARALVGNPSIIILDEATASLDPVVEKLIDDNIRKRGATCIIIAHRVSTVRDADEIIVMDKGTIVERGIHEEMVNVDGPYRSLILTN